MYPTDLVMPMKAELTDKGFQDLTTPAQVEDALKQSGTTLLVINSVCGCAAGAARPRHRLEPLRLHARRVADEAFPHAHLGHRQLPRQRRGTHQLGPGRGGGQPQHHRLPSQRRLPMRTGQTRRCPPWWRWWSTRPAAGRCSGSRGCSCAAP